MTATRTYLLMEAWLDGGIDDAELVELEAALLESAELRREFWSRASLHGLIREAVKIVGSPPQVAGGAGILAQQSSWLHGSFAARVAVLLLGGCGIGSVLTSMAFAYAGLRGWDARSVVIHEEGFEQPPAPRQDFIPQQPDVWSGDETEVVGVHRNVFPRTGGHMLRFVSGHPQGDVYEGKGAEIWRIIDVKAARAAAGSRDVRIDFSAAFNGVDDRADPAREPLQFWVTAVATDAPPAELAGLWNDRFLYDDISPTSLSAAQSRDAIDADPVTWERIATSLAIPARARFVVLHCTAALPAAAVGADQLPGYYVDDISVVVTPVASVEDSRTAGPRPRDAR